MFPCSARHELFRLSLCFNFSRRNGVIRRCIPDVTVKRRDLDMVWRTDGYSCYGCKNGIANTYSTYFVPLRLPRTKIFLPLLHLYHLSASNILEEYRRNLFLKISIVQLFLNRNNAILILLSPSREARKWNDFRLLHASLNLAGLERISKSAWYIYLYGRNFHIHPHLYTYNMSSRIELRRRKF